jgi:N-acetylneuraminate 9-O-acetyltransferase
VFWATARKLDRDHANNELRVADKHGDVDLQYAGVKLEFVWDPFLNSSRLKQELEYYQEFGIRDSRLSSVEAANRTASLILLGGGLWHARQYDVGAFRRFKTEVEKITDYTSRTATTAFDSTQPFLGGDEGVGDIVFLAPLEDPLYLLLSPSRRASILPEEIDQMNGFLHTLTPSDGLIVPWTYENMVSGRRWAYEESGLHVVDAVATRRADILLNMRCNAKLDAAIGAPFRRTCCTAYHNGKQAQWFLRSVVLAPLLTLMLASKCTPFLITNPS